MTKVKKVSLAITAAALAIGGIAYAQMPEGRANIDADGDGVITRAEAQSGATAMFAKMDANQDGKLDQSDREAMRGKMFDMLDTDKNGSISRQEFTAKGHGRDGMEGPHGPGGHRMGGHHDRKGGMMMMMSKMADTNNDGAVSRDEFVAAGAKHFDMADANKDGKITKEERVAAHQKMKDAGKARKAADSGTSN